jgi:hypothetical protein
METIEFHAVLDQDQIIRPPEGVSLPRGEAEVTVRPLKIETATDSLGTMRGWLLALSADAERAAPGLPSENAKGSENAVESRSGAVG